MKIRGNTVGTPMPRPDWNQDNPRAADYILNKPDLSAINAEYRHIATYDHTADESTTTIEFTEDKDGNPFSCSEFYIYAKVPASPAGNQLYVGTDWAKWMLFSGMGIRQTDRTFGIEVYHIGDGWWRGRMLVTDNVASEVTATNGYNEYTNWRSNVVIGEKAEKLLLYSGNAVFSKGTIIEVYGK